MAAKAVAQADVEVERPSPTTANGLVRSTSAPPPDASWTTNPEVVRTPGKIRPAENDAGAWLALVNSASVRTLATVAPAAHTTIATTSMRSRVDPTREWSRPRRAAGWLVKVSLLSP